MLNHDVMQPRTEMKLLPSSAAKARVNTFIITAPLASERELRRKPESGAYADQPTAHPGIRYRITYLVGPTATADPCRPAATADPCRLGTTADPLGSLRPLRPQSPVFDRRPITPCHPRCRATGAMSPTTGESQTGLCHRRKALDGRCVLPAPCLSRSCLS